MSEERVPGLSRCLLKNSTKKKKSASGCQKQNYHNYPLASHIISCIAFNKCPCPGGEYICYETVFSIPQSKAKQINGITISFHNCCFPHALEPPQISTRQVSKLGALCHRSSLDETTEEMCAHSAWVQMWLADGRD